MPILLSQEELDNEFTTNNTQPAIKVSEFFHKKLTGDGRTKRGRLDGSINPFSPNINASKEINHWLLTGSSRKLSQRETSISAGVEKRVIPVAPLDASLLSALLTFSHKEGAAGRSYYRDYVYDRDAIDLWDVLGRTGEKWNVHVDVTPLSIMLYDITDKDNPSKNTHIVYRTTVYFSCDVDPIDDETAFDTFDIDYTSDIAAHIESETPFCVTGVTQEPLQFLKEAINATGVITSLTYDEVELLRAWGESEYNVVEHIINHVHTLTSDALEREFYRMVHYMHMAIVKNESDYGVYYETVLLHAVTNTVRMWESMRVTLEAYAAVHASLNDLENVSPDPSHARALVRHIVENNVQLQLNDNLQRLYRIRDQLTTLPDPTTYTFDDKFSIQQRAAIGSTDPLTLVQAGAGTGKSTVILGRIKYLTDNGVSPESIHVLSFTNAAADNIREKNPGVVSRTIAKMIAEVYHNTYDHMVSSIPTMLNTIDIMYQNTDPTSETIIRFKSLLRALDEQNNNANMTAMSNFVKNNFDDVIKILDTIRQTSLELQIIITALKIDTMPEPFSSPEHIIIDEVQDNSSFEFVYTLLFAARHTCSLYLVGDSSQTLYEFRAANPKALNALESSGVFSAFQLTTNYRSNQEILDYANMVLTTVESNKYAKIQLQANSLDVPTESSFCEKVKLDSVSVDSREYRNHFEEITSRASVRDFIKDAFDRGESVAMIAMTRHEVRNIEKFIKDSHPDRTYLNLTAEIPLSYTVFSEFISKYWGEVTALPPNFAATAFSQSVISHAMTLLPRHLAKNRDMATTIVTERVRKWWAESKDTINRLVARINDGSLDKDEFYDLVRNNIIDFEIRNNAITASLAFNRNNKKKELFANGEEPDFFVSTIHGVKGLEFDNVIVFLKPDPTTRPISEEDKRMFYVALTRAKSHELIVKADVGDPKNSSFAIHYDRIVKTLAERDLKMAQAEAEHSDPYLVSAGSDNSDDGDNTADSSDDTADADNDKEGD